MQISYGHCPWTLPMDIAYGYCLWILPLQINPTPIDNKILNFQTNQKFKDNQKFMKLSMIQKFNNFESILKITYVKTLQDLIKLYYGQQPLTTNILPNGLFRSSVHSCINGNNQKIFQTATTKYPINQKIY